MTARRLRHERLQPPPLVLALRYLRRNKALAIGVFDHPAVGRCSPCRRLTVDPTTAYPLSAPAKKPPSLAYPLGTDFFGRNLLAAMVVGMWQTAVIGLHRRRPRHA